MTSEVMCCDNMDYMATVPDGYFELAIPGYKIFDSHVGSGSSRIACYDMGFDFIGCEKDKDYRQAQEKRYHDYTAQADLFSGEELQKNIYKGGE